MALPISSISEVCKKVRDFVSTGLNSVMTRKPTRGLAMASSRTHSTHRFCSVCAVRKNERRAGVLKKTLRTLTLVPTGPGAGRTGRSLPPSTSMTLAPSFGGTQGVCIRPRVADVSGFEAEFISCTAVDPDFSESSFLLRDSNLRAIGGALAVDLSRIIGLSIAVETLGSPMVSASATEVQVDQVVRVAEPTPVNLHAIALLALCAIGWRRQPAANSL